MTRAWTCISVLLVAAGVFFVGAGSPAAAKDLGVEKTFLDGLGSDGMRKKKTRGSVIAPTDQRDVRRVKTGEGKKGTGGVTPVFPGGARIKF